jgi:hypothetical protein
MSIFIKGMEMPAHCGECPIETNECRLWENFVARWERRHPDCPLVEIPTPHGRLIDADKLKDRLVLHGNSPEQAQLYANICEWIDLQETVIEAEGET